MPSDHRAPPTHDPLTTPCQFWVRLGETEDGMGEKQFFRPIRVVNGIVVSYAWEFDHAEPVDFSARRAENLRRVLRYIMGKPEE
jgi:hypothetical protein